MKRIAWLLITALLLASLSGCGSDGSDKRKGAPSDEDAIKATDKASAEAYPALKLETDGEKGALAIAESDEGRKWASGDWQNGPAVEGDARLVGYTFRINDGTTQYQVRIMGDQVPGYVGGSSDKVLAGQYDAGWYSDPAPETDRQRAAWELALAEVAKVNPNATQGGIESYIFLFPAKEDGSWPEVLVYADGSYGNFAMGGTWFE